MQAVLEAAAELALDLASRAGALARGAFGSRLVATPKTSLLDIVTDVDHAAEELITAGIRKCFPDHGIMAEEAGITATDGPWTWLVDPLDGTNNFAIGLPLYGLSLVLTHEGRPLLALVQDSHLDRRVCLTSDGEPVASPGVDLTSRSLGASSTVALQQGYAVPRDDPALSAIRQAMASHFQRVLYTWSPSIDLLLLATGSLGGIVAYRCVGPEHVAARFVADRIGCILRSDGNDAVRDPSTYAVGRPDVVDRAWPVVACSRSEE